MLCNVFGIFKKTLHKYLKFNILFILTLRVMPGSFKYSPANTEAWSPFCGTHDGRAPPPSSYMHLAPTGSSIIYNIS